MITGLLGEFVFTCPEQYLFQYNPYYSFEEDSGFLKSQPKTRVASTAPANWEMMNAGACPGKIPLNVFEKLLAMVTAGLAKLVDAVNQYAAVM